MKKGGLGEGLQPGLLALGGGGWQELKTLAEATSLPPKNPFSKPSPKKQQPGPPRQLRNAPTKILDIVKEILPMEKIWPLRRKAAQ